MRSTLSDYGAGFVLGLVGMAAFFYIAFHWRAVCRRIDRWETQKNRTVGHSEKFIAFSNIFTPVYLIFSMALLFVGSIVLLVGCGAPIFSPPSVQDTVRPLAHPR